MRIHVYACFGDSPEKSTISHITRGNGTYTSRWGHLIDIKRVHLHIYQVDVDVEMIISSVGRIKSTKHHIHVKIA